MTDNILPAVKDSFDFSVLRNTGNFFKGDLPDKVQMDIYHLEGAPKTRITPLCKYKGRYMDKHSAVCLYYLEHLDSGEFISVTNSIKLASDDYNRKLYPHQSNKHLDRVALNINRILGKIHCEMEISKPELVTMAYKLLNEPKVEYVNAGYESDGNGGKIFKKRKIKKPLTILEKKGLMEFIAKLEGHVSNSDNTRGFLTPPKDMETEITFKFKKTPPPGAEKPVIAKAEVVDG